MFTCLNNYPVPANTDFCPVLQHTMLHNQGLYEDDQTVVHYNDLHWMNFLNVCKLFLLLSCPAYGNTLQNNTCITDYRWNHWNKPSNRNFTLVSRLLVDLKGSTIGDTEII